MNPTLKQAVEAVTSRNDDRAMYWAVHWAAYLAVNDESVNWTVYSAVYRDVESAVNLAVRSAVDLAVNEVVSGTLDR